MMTTLRCPCVHTNNCVAVERTLAKLVRFEKSAVRYSENTQKYNHWAMYVDVIEFIDSKFETDFNTLVLKECLKVFLPNGAYVLVGIGKNQEQCDAEEAAKLKLSEHEVADEEIEFGV